MKRITFLCIISTVLTGKIIQFLSGLINVDLFSWSFLFVFPVGAIATAYINLIILSLFASIFRFKKIRNSLLNSTLSTLIIIFMLAFYDPAQTVIQYKSMTVAENLPLWWAWLLWGIKIMGYWLTSIILYGSINKAVEEGEK